MNYARERKFTIITVWILVAAGVIITAIIALNLNIRLIRDSEKTFADNLKFTTESSGKSLQLFMDAIISEIVLLTEVDAIKNYNIATTDIAFRGVITKHGDIISYITLLDKNGDEKVTVTDIENPISVNSKMRDYYKANYNKWHIGIDSETFLSDSVRYISVSMPIFRKLSKPKDRNERASILYTEGMVVVLINIRDLISKFVPIEDSPTSKKGVLVLNNESKIIFYDSKFKHVAELIYADTDNPIDKIANDIRQLSNRHDIDRWTHLDYDRSTYQLKLEDSIEYVTISSIDISDKRWLVTVMKPRDEAVTLVSSYNIQSMSLFIIVTILLLAAGVIITNYSMSIVRAEEKAKTAHILEAKNLSLNNLNRQMDEFVSVVSHDIRSPLSVIRGLAKLIESDEVGKSRFKDEISTILISCDRLLQLVLDILDLSKMEAGKITLNLESVNLDHLLYESVSTLSNIDPDKKLKFVMELGDVTIIKGDTSKILRLFNNLISNSIHFSPAGSSIVIKKAIEDGEVVIDFIDSGPGIPADQIGIVFEKFEQVKSQRRGSQPGSGLGLTISKGIVELHNGSINVNSSEDGGTVFTVKLPVTNGKDQTDG